MKWISLMALLWLTGANCAYAGDPACAKNYLTLRKGPGPQFPVSWKVARYMPFLKMENKNGWVRVQDLDGESHWAPARDLSAAMHCVVVRALTVTLRQAPSATAPISDLHSVDRFTPFKRIENQADWVHVEDETGRQAWIHESHLWKPVKIQNVDF